MRTARYLCLLSVVAVMIPACDAQEGGTDRSADAKAFVSLLTANDFSKATGMFDETMRKALPETKLRDTWEALSQQAGAFQRQEGTRTTRVQAYDVVFVTCAFERARLDVKVVFDGRGRVAGLFFVPAPAGPIDAPAAYITPGAYHEREVTIGSGTWAVPGTLTLPNGAGPFPAVLLVHGSGPQDRDETIGANKPFRDIAWGLASKGVAVLRYEKRTKAHGADLNPLPLPFTVKEETIDDAVAAVDLLRTTPEIDEGRVYVLGHSLGGMLMPRILAASKGTAGGIILAGTTRPLEDVITEQTNYLSLLDGQKSAEEQRQIDAVQALANRVKQLNENDAQNAELLFGAPASYWLDLRKYDPVEAVRATQQPLLVLQGERDYQVTMKDFDRWKAALSARTDVHLKSYPGLNHLFFEGKGPANPGEYDVPGHVAEQVITDIAAWINR